MANTSMQKITPFLWFDNQAEDAANFYVSIFDNSKIVSVARYGEAAAEAAGRPAGSVMTVAFQLEGQEFVALNGGPVFKFTEALSFVVKCQTQDEIDRLWEKLSEGGAPGQCGWLTDRYGLAWQVVPADLDQILGHPAPEIARRAMQALLTMSKLDVARLKQA